MRINPIVFIAFMGADNHGIGYMRAVLRDGGFITRVLDLRKGKLQILKSIREINPRIIGFSVIYQSYINKFTELAGYLRKEGISCHFTAGGHYASLRYEELFDANPALDSIIRFEGEYTMLELANCIYSKAEWTKIDGLVYKLNNEIVDNPLRPIEKDLDRIPFPVRPPLKNFAFNEKFAAMIAGRGCNHSCSFCNTQEYYFRMPGPKKRVRQPQLVVKEIEELHKRKSCSIFMFDDDDFPVKTNKEIDWTAKFCKNLKKAGLYRKIIWKINCRPDEVEEKNFRLMKKHGLFHVFLGLEDGTDSGLKKLNKQSTVKQNLKSINILRRLGIGYDFGFMLFQPDTTFETLNENLEFLTVICGDGYTPVTFNKLQALYETKVEKDLRKAGRLLMVNGREDYCFMEESMNQYYNFIISCFNKWITDPDGVENISKMARNYFEVHSRLPDKIPETGRYHSRIRKLISESNSFLLDTLKTLAAFFESGLYMENSDILKNYRKIIRSNHDYFKICLENTLGEFVQSVYSFKISPEI